MHRFWGIIFLKKGQNKLTVGLILDISYIMILILDSLCKFREKNGWDPLLNWRKEIIGLISDKFWTVWLIFEKNEKTSIISN